ncbi:3-oxoacyl-[acyl-carrier-protein] reductase FabG [Buchnera aphidicola (Chaitophorus sp. 3695)]|uniref:3-oxoacyl-ACP reductase FabG n=1 Tax=Buchnera aphidicola TaxID=9 RepID=UPI003463C0A2
MKKKNVLVTGARKGIGKSILKRFIKKEFFIIGTSRTLTGAKKIQKIVKKNGFGMILKINNYSEINFFLEKIMKKIGNIDILIHNIGTTKDRLINNISKKNWDNIINTNLTSVFYITKKIIKHMIKRKFGRIISIGSISGFVGNPGQTHYSSSKSALIGFTKSLSLEVACRGITVNLISPGFIKTNMLNKLTVLQLKKCLKKIPMRKFGNPKDIAYLVKFLSSKKASYITGQTIHINGGICIL